MSAPTLTENAQKMATRILQRYVASDFYNQHVESVTSPFAGETRYLDLAENDENTMDLIGRHFYKIAYAHVVAQLENNPDYTPETDDSLFSQFSEGCFRAKTTDGKSQLKISFDLARTLGIDPDKYQIITKANNAEHVLVLAVAALVMPEAERHKLFDGSVELKAHSLHEHTCILVLHLDRGKRKELLGTASTLAVSKENLPEVFKEIRNLHCLEGLLDPEKLECPAPSFEEILQFQRELVEQIINECWAKNRIVRD